MKNALMLPLVFCITILTWTFILGLFTVMDSSQVLTALLDGEYAEFFLSLGFRILDLLPFTIPFSFLFLFFFLMRHKGPWWLTVPIITGLAAVSIFVLIPLSWNVSVSLGKSRSALEASLADRVDRVMAPGIIRRNSDGLRSIWFNVNEGGDTVYPVVTLNTVYAPPKPALSVFDSCRYDSSGGGLWQDNRLVVSRAGGAEAQLVTLTESVPFLNVFRSVTQPVLSGWLAASYRGGIPYYIEAGSLFLAILALCTLSFFTGWRLLNMLFSFLAFGLVYKLYPAVHSGIIWQRLSSFSPAAGLTDLIGPLCYVILALLIMTVFGTPSIIRYAYRRNGGGRND